MPLLNLTVARAALVRDLADDAVPRPSFYILVLLSTAIASYGLLANSTAVVIGAMLIAPLIGLIYGIALGLLREDRRLFLMASLSEGVGIMLAIGLAVVIGSYLSDQSSVPKSFSHEAESLRSARGDCGGRRRCLRALERRISPTLPGVAIATALVPPLAVCGLCLADARWDAALVPSCCS